jgi:hypothetical protein
MLLTGCEAGACPACPAAAATCIDPCELDHFYKKDYPCQACESPRCDKGCVRAEDCNLCEDRLCYECTKFVGTCTSCITNAEFNFEGTQCFCKPTYGFRESDDTCVLCDITCETCNDTTDKSCLTCKKGAMRVDMSKP